MSTVDNYRLLVRSDYGDLGKDVMMFIKEGWQPLGAPFFYRLMLCAGRGALLRVKSSTDARLMRYPILKDCPCCGKQPSWHYDQGDERSSQQWHIACQCGIRTESEWGSNTWASSDSEDNAVKAKLARIWNRRP